MVDYTTDPFIRTGINLDNINPTQIFNPNYEVGRKGGGDDQNKYTKVKRYTFKEHLNALNNHPISRGWDNARKNMVSTFLTAHKIFENGWIIGPGKKAWAGYGNVQTAQDFVNRMFERYPKAMNSLRWQDYLSGLLSNSVDGMPYNPRKQAYIQELNKGFGPGTRAWYQPTL